MALTESNMLPLGTEAPNFLLKDVVSGSHVSLDDLKSTKATVIMFICNHCPFVIHVNSELVRLGNKYKSEGVSFIAISSNDIESHPQDGPSYMKLVAQVLKYPFPYLFDKRQEVAKAYDAACTPDFYVFDGALKLTYRGRLDASRPGNNVALSGADLSNAIENTLAGNEIAEQIPSAGCNIKWK